MIGWFKSWNKYAWDCQFAQIASGVRNDLVNGDDDCDAIRKLAVTSPFEVAHASDPNSDHPRHASSGSKHRVELVRTLLVFGHMGFPLEKLVSTGKAAAKTLVRRRRILLLADEAGGGSSAPNTKRPADLIQEHAAAAEKLRLLYVACGDKDGLFRISRATVGDEAKRYRYEHRPAERHLPNKIEGFVYPFFHGPSRLSH